MSPAAPKGAPNSKKVKPPQIPESLLARLWRDRAARQENFKTGEGHTIKVLYTGRKGSEAGPDFRDALLYREDVGLVRGDVELHLRPGDWNSHGHGADHRYNGVVLHGVLTGPGTPPLLRNGSKAPAVCLQSLLDTPPPSKSGPPKQRSFLWSIMASHGYPEPLNRIGAQETLFEAGMARFWRKSKAFTALIREIPWQEVMYQAILECLGYSENRDAFAELAQLLPYEALKKATTSTGQRDRPKYIEKMLLETSGLQPAGGEALSSNPTMHPSRWRLFRIRPSNHPRHRMAGAAALLDRFLDVGLQTGRNRVSAEQLLQDTPAESNRPWSQGQTGSHWKGQGFRHSCERSTPLGPRLEPAKRRQFPGRRNPGRIQGSASAPVQPANPRDGRGAVPR